MKLYSNNLLENLTKDELANLTLEVKETMAKEFKNEKKRIFSDGFFYLEHELVNFSVCQFFQEVV